MHPFVRSPLAEQVCARNYGLADRARGRADPHTCIFLTTLIERLHPATMVEIGVAAGTSTLMILKFIEATNARTRLISFDVRDTYYLDPALPVGWLINENYTSPPAGWSLNTGKISADVAATIAPARAGLVFIDGSHDHPWPAFDVLNCLAFCDPGAWLVLHDINLPRMYPEDQSWGAVWVFEGWTGDKLADTSHDPPYAGAILLSEDRGRDIDNLLGVMDAQQETKHQTKIDRQYWTKMRASLDPLLTEAQRQRLDALRIRLSP